MNSPKTCPSPTYRNLKSRNKCSPIEMKEKLRKNYKEKVHNCRNILINRIRGAVEESDLKHTLANIYKNMFESDDTLVIDEEEMKILEDIKTELVQEEFEWWLEEYEKSQLENIDWSSMEGEDSVICPICQKSNLVLQNHLLSCNLCNSSIRTEKSLVDIKNSILSSLEQHSAVCNKESQFTLMPEFDQNHIYLICSGCTDIHVAV